MPIYEFLCADSGSGFELLVLKSSGAPRCPSCESEALERRISLPSVRSEQSRARSARDIRARNRALRTEHGRAEEKRKEAQADSHHDD